MGTCVNRVVTPSVNCPVTAIPMAISPVRTCGNSANDDAYDGDDMIVDGLTFGNVDRSMKRYNP